MEARPDGAGKEEGGYQEGTKEVRGAVAAMRTDSPGEGEGGSQEGPKGIQEEARWWQ